MSIFAITHLPGLIYTYIKPILVRVGGLEDILDNQSFIILITRNITNTRPIDSQEYSIS